MRTGLIESQGPAVGINKFGKVLGRIGILRLTLSGMIFCFSFNFLTILTSF